MPNALYIGRFQPFHIGHLDAINQALELEDYLLIGIGSAEDSFLKTNPFTAGERFEMIQSSLDEAGVSRSKYSIIPIRNINNYSLWVSHVEMYCPPFQNVYTGSDIVKGLFESHGKHPIVKPKFNHKICATDIRQKIIDNDSWQDLVPPAVEKVLVNINAKARLQSLPA